MQTPGSAGLPPGKRVRARGQPEWGLTFWNTRDLCAYRPRPERRSMSDKSERWQLRWQDRVPAPHESLWFRTSSSFTPDFEEGEKVCAGNYSHGPAILDRDYRRVSAAKRRHQ